MLALGAATALSVLPAQQADAGIYYRRVAPVRRVAARAVLPPYPVARRAVVGPVYRPVVGRPVVGRPVVAPYYAPRPIYSPGVSVYVGF